MFAGEFVNHEIGTMYKKSTAQAAKDAFIIIYRRPLANLLYGLAVRWSVFHIRLLKRIFVKQVYVDIAVTKI